MLSSQQSEPIVDYLPYKHTDLKETAVVLLFENGTRLWQAMIVIVNLNHVVDLSASPPSHHEWSSTAQATATDKDLVVL